ncbi:hypothetical protein G6O67_008466 [Ophiocordyceps sinensis]|nr:hypothetical protein G6O67_008466 [Ophiocordyceps sinensis]
MALALSILATSQANMQDFRLFQRQTWCPAESRPITTHKCTDGYCVYTDARFWGGRGISFLTTADAMDKTVRRGLEQHYRPGFVTKVAVDAFEEREVAGKGVGLVAKRLLRRGELIIAEPPSVMVHLDMRTSVSEETRLEMQRAAVDALPRGTRLETLGLAGRGRGDAVEDILDTNSFTVTLAKAWDHHALFTQTSRLNHACRPNCQYNFNRRTLTHSVYTMRDVYPGQELTISYIDPTATYQERRGEIQFWGFNCSCSACELPRQARDESDKTMGLIRQYTDELKDWSNRSRATPDMAEALMELYRRESLYCRMADGYRLAAHAYSAVRDRYNALRMANDAMGYGLQTWMDMGARMMDVLLLLADAEAHWTWNQRRDRQDWPSSPRQQMASNV